jgi:hypothetical protein
MTGDNDATAIPPRSRLERADRSLWANDFTMRSWLSPDGLRALPLEQAIEEL